MIAHIKSIAEGDAGSFAVQLNGTTAEAADVLKAETPAIVVTAMIVGFHNATIMDASSYITQSDQFNNTDVEFLPVSTVSLRQSARLPSQRHPHRGLTIPSITL